MLDALFRAAFVVAYRLARVWWFVRRPHVRGAFVAVWYDGALLLVRNSYRRGETIPSGHVGRREAPREAARRELFEEVGIDVPEEDLSLALEFELQWDHKQDHATIYEWHPVDRPVVRVDAREVIWGDFVAEAELEARPLVPHVRRYLAWREGQPGSSERTAKQPLPSQKT